MRSANLKRQFKNSDFTSMQSARFFTLILTCAVFCTQVGAETTESTASADPAFVAPPDTVENQKNSFIACADHDLTGQLRLPPRQVGGIPNSAMAADSIRFFREYIAYLEKYAEQYHTAGVVMEICYSIPNLESDLCKGFREFEQTELREKIRVARYELSMSLGYDEEPNTRLRPGSDSVKMVAWDRLNDEEKERAAKNLKTYSTQIREKNGWSQSFNVPTDVNTFMDKMESLRATHYKRYIDIMSELPILQYVRSLNPSQQELASAAKKLMENAKRSWDHLEQIKKQLNEYESLRAPYAYPADLHGLLDYRPHLEGFLLGNSQHCPLANDLYNLHARYTTLRTYTTVGLLFVGTAVASPIVAVGAGAVASAGFGTTSYMDYQKVKAHSFATYRHEEELPYLDDQGKPLRDSQGNKVTNPFRGGTMASVTAARNQFKTEMYMLPLGFVGAKLPKWTKTTPAK